LHLICMPLCMPFRVRFARGHSAVATRGRKLASTLKELQARRGWREKMKQKKKKKKKKKKMAMMMMKKEEERNWGERERERERERE